MKIYYKDKRNKEVLEYVGILEFGSSIGRFAKGSYKKAPMLEMRRVERTKSDELEEEKLKDFMSLLQKVTDYYEHRVKCTNSDELKYDELNDFMFLLQKADGSFTYRHPDLVEYTEDEIHSKELKPGCVVECIKPESVLYGKKLVVEDVEGLTIRGLTDESKRKEIDIFSIKVV